MEKQLRVHSEKRSVLTLISQFWQTTKCESAETIVLFGNYFSVFGNYKKRQLNKISILLLSLAYGRHFSLFEIRSFPRDKIILNQRQDYEDAVVEVE